MARGTPQEKAERQARRMQESLQIIQQGVEAVTVAPGVAAAAKADKWAKAVQDSKEKWRANVASVSLDAWQSAFIEKGIPRIAAGAELAIPLMTQFHEQLDAYRVGLDRTLAGMPDLTLEQRINRMVTNTREMAKFRFKR